MKTTHLLYLHGFLSSPLSAKARLTGEVVARRHPKVVFHCPALPASPKQAMDEVLQAIADWPRASMAMMGSSLGGFYATWLAERLGCKAALLNPAVTPARDLAAQIGTHAYWHQPDLQFDFTPAHVGELRTLEVPMVSRPERYCAVIAKGDEVLDWRQMHAHYQGARIKLLPGGDHALSDYDQHLDEVLDFLDLA